MQNITIAIITYLYSIVLALHQLALGDCIYINYYLFIFFGPGNFIFDHASPTGEMLLTVVLLRGRDFIEIEPFKGICHNNIYTVVGYTINQINYDDNGAYGDTKSVKKDYYVQKEMVN